MEALYQLPSFLRSIHGLQTLVDVGVPAHCIRSPLAVLMSEFGGSLTSHNEGHVTRYDHAYSVDVQQR